jgi:hypothetical protein
VLSQLLPKFRDTMAANAPAKEQIASPTTPEPPAGKWRGFIRTYNGDVPLTFDFNGSATSTASLGDVTDIKLPKVRINPGWYAFTIEGDLGLEDTGRGPYNINIYVTQEGDLLYGSAQIRASKHPDTPSLSYWVEMVKQ